MQEFGVTKYGYAVFYIEDLIICHYRFDPIPGTGNKYRNKYYRHIKTTQELKWNFVYSEYTRSKRTKRYLPSFWDECIRNNHSKSWKDCTKRRKQYK